MHMVPGSSSWKFLTLENHPQGGGGGTICVLHQPPGVTDVSVLEGSQFACVGAASDRFPGALPLFGVSQEPLWGWRDGAIHTDREGMVNVGIVFPRHSASRSECPKGLQDPFARPRATPLPLAHS